MYDVAVIGAGPAGLAASITLVCEGKSVVLIDQANNVGGQIAHSHLVENVVGYSRGFSGVEFASESHEQAINLGVTIMLGHPILMLFGSAGDFVLLTEHRSIHARAVLITIGVNPRPIPFEVATEEGGCNVVSALQLQPSSPSEHVLVYGGGNSAGQAAVYYAKLGCSVSILSRRPLEETMDQRWIASLFDLGVDNLIGEIQHVANNTVVFESSGEQQQLIPHTIHAFVGGEPVTHWLYGVVELDGNGYIITDSLHCTSTHGVFAAGDCEAGSIKRFSCAIGRASEASNSVSRYLGGL